MEGLIGQLQSAQMMALKDKPEDVKDLKVYGLDKPEVTATISSGASSVVLQLGGTADPVTLWARDPSKPTVFSIGNGLAEELRKTANDLRRKEIFEFRPFNATRFEITRGKDTKVFERVKGTGANAPDTWKADGAGGQNGGREQSRGRAPRVLKPARGGLRRQSRTPAPA